MIYKFRRREARPFITLGELVQARQPSVYYPLAYFAADSEQDKTEIARTCYAHIEREVVLTAAYLTGHLKCLARLMEETPKPGRGGQ
jgi:hypothetical protein